MGGGDWGGPGLSYKSGGVVSISMPSKATGLRVFAWEIWQLESTHLQCCYLG